MSVACSSTDSVLGTELQSATLAPGFALHDQSGRPVSLDDYRGKVVVLTFLYTSCPDICPIVASHLRDVHQALGADADDVAIVAITVDPERDTVESALEYSDRWRMQDSWAFLVGAREVLEPVWADYYVAAIADARGASQTPPAPLPGVRKSGVDALHERIANAYLVTHSAPVYLIDRDGLMRVVFTLPFDPDDLVHDIRLLLG